MTWPAPNERDCMSFDRRIEHIGHDLYFIETGTEFRQIRADPDRRTGIWPCWICAKSDGWELENYEIRCRTCNNGIVVYDDEVIPLEWEV